MEERVREQRCLIEGIVFASPEPVSAKRIANLVQDCDTKEVHAQICELNDEYETQGRAFRFEKVAGGYQLRTVAELAPALRALRPTPPVRLSPASLETLAVVAYRQPVTRTEVENIRGVEAGPVLRSLLERELVRVAGHREVPGRPMLYATTKRFLEVLGLNSLSDLPTLQEVEELVGSDALPEAAPTPAPEQAAAANVDAATVEPEANEAPTEPTHKLH